ncbi:4'-phosphopantetheinyl transferase family protein [Brevibacillus agri]|uniref:4'-phosphopantetheinyl transferase family protein n=1 Tax=Brevibacillus agri TaxID=51101 RepID=UPI003D1D4DDE
MIEIYIGKIPEKIEIATFQKLLNCVSYEKQLRINRFSRHKDALRTLLAEILVRMIICKKFKIKNHEIVVGTNSYGKPFLYNDVTFSFNVSHSGDWVVCAVHQHPVGIDVEKLEPINLDIAKHFFRRRIS